MTPEEQIVMKVAELEQSLLAAHPAMPTYLKAIHLQLQQQPELLHILKPEQRAVIVKGLDIATGTMLTQAALKSSKKPSAKSLANASLADLGI